MIKQIRKNTLSKQTTIAVIILFFISSISIISTNIIFIKAEAEEPIYQNQDGVNDFNYSKKITINHSQVAENLYGFPVLINLTNDEDLFAHCINNSGYDVAFFNESNITKFPHEIEYWNWDIPNSTVDAYIWVNVSFISATSNTVFYMYYGNNNTNQENITGTWSNNYAAVYHCTGLSALNIDDSTINNNNADGDDGNVNYNQNYPIYKGFAFDGSGDQVNISGSTWLNNSMEVAFATWIFINNNAQPDGIFFSRGIYACGIGLDGGQHYKIYVNDGSNKRETFSTNTISTGSWHYLVGTYNGNENPGWIELYVDGKNVSTNTDGTGTGGIWQNDVFYFGYDNFEVARHLNGAIDDLQVLTTNVSAGWVLTNYNMINNMTNGGFFNLGPEHGDNSTYRIKGLTNNKITWHGIAGHTVYCNASGDRNETLEINMSINTSDNVTEVRVFIGDLNNTEFYINASNITLYISSDNISYGEMGTFTDGGNNISINVSTWPVGAGASPFLGTGLTNKTTSIYCIFRLAIPADAINNIFYNSNSYYIYIMGEL